MVDPRLIVVDHRYQRAEKPVLIAAISTDPRWELFGMPICFKRSHTFYCVDGQQRIAGVLRSGAPPREVPVVWFDQVHLRDEAAFFTEIQEFRIALSAMEKHKGKIVAENPATLAIERVAALVGVTITDKMAASEESRTITAISTVYYVYEQLGEDGLTQTLTVCRDAFEEDTGGFSAPILRAVANLIEEQGENYERAKLTAALKTTTPGKLRRKAEELRFDIGGSLGQNMRRAIKLLAKV
jgi:hypothetical protein